MLVGGFCGKGESEKGGQKPNQKSDQCPEYVGDRPWCVSQTTDKQPGEWQAAETGLTSDRGNAHLSAHSQAVRCYNYPCARTLCTHIVQARNCDNVFAGKPYLHRYRIDQLLLAYIRCQHGISLIMVWIIKQPVSTTFHTFSFHCVCLLLTIVHFFEKKSRVYVHSKTTETLVASWVYKDDAVIGQH